MLTFILSEKLFQTLEMRRFGLLHKRFTIFRLTRLGEITVKIKVNNVGACAATVEVWDLD